MEPLLEQLLSILMDTPLFSGFTAQELARLLVYLQPAVRDCPKDETLLMAGEEAQALGVVLTGEIEAQKLTRAGGMFTVSRMGPGGVFGDVLAASGVPSPVTVVTLSACRVLLLPREHLFAQPAGPALPDAELYRRLLANMVAVISGKYFELDSRVDLLLVVGLRRRVAAYLLDAGRDAGTDEFTIPYDRAGLAAYLGCERSALSREISAMVNAGLISTRRSVFRIPNPDALRALF